MAPPAAFRVPWSLPPHGSLTGRDYNETYFLGRRQLRSSCVDETTTALESEPLTCAEQVARTSQGLDWDVRQGTPVCSVR